MLRQSMFPAGGACRVEAQASKSAVINCSCAICEHQLLGLASLLCRSSDSLGEFRSDECAAPVKLLEDEVQHVFLGRRLRVWQKVPPERHAFLVGDNHFTDAWVLHGRVFASEAKIPRSDPRRGYCPVDSASVIIKRGDVTPWHFARVGRTDLPQNSAGRGISHRDSPSGT